jgi:hypothetical protein
LPDGAACRFDPELHDGPDRVESAGERAARVQVAREVCVACPVLEECLDYVVRVRPERGVWGGFTAAEHDAVAAVTDDEPFGEVA